MSFCKRNGNICLKHVDILVNFGEITTPLTPPKCSFNEIIEGMPNSEYAIYFNHGTLKTVVHLTHLPDQMSDYTFLCIRWSVIDTNAVLMNYKAVYDENMRDSLQNLQPELP
jgi:hypothetical protein